jgi:aryl-alcohol dehydrogenase-like predicted oxidoreductase
LRTICSARQQWRKRRIRRRELCPHAVAKGTEPELFFDSPENVERRTRATTLAKKRGVSVNTIALAWVLRQDFPSFAVIGARTPGEIATSIASLDTQLTPDECAWLNLETD